MSVCFSNARLAAIVAPVLLFLAVLPKYIFFGSNANEAVNLLPVLVLALVLVRLLCLARGLLRWCPNVYH